MSIDALTQGRIGSRVSHLDSSDTLDRHTRRAEASEARSAANISAWQSYLPQDCIDAMIKMGWDHSV